MFEGILEVEVGGDAEGDSGVAIEQRQEYLADKLLSVLREEVEKGVPKDDSDNAFVGSVEDAGSDEGP